METQNSDTAEIDLGRERVAAVFGLDGGELHGPDPRFPDEWDGPNGVRLWYSGPPSYAEDPEKIGGVKCPACKGRRKQGADCPTCEDKGHVELEVRTAILCCVDGPPPVPMGWKQVAKFRSSGEATCPWCSGASVVGRMACTFCEGDGWVFIGDCWFEVVYVRVDETDQVRTA